MAYPQVSDDLNDPYLLTDKGLRIASFNAMTHGGIFLVEALIAIRAERSRILT
jgi:hypothetical protein